MKEKELGWGGETDEEDGEDGVELGKYLAAVGRGLGIKEGGSAGVKRFAEVMGIQGRERRGGRRGADGYGNDRPRGGFPVLESSARLGCMG